MLFHQAARSGNLYADVLFNPTFRGTNAGYFWQARRIISETSRMPSLGVAIATAVNRWQELRQHPGSRLLLAAQAQGWELDLGSLNPAPRVEGRAPELPAGQTRYAVTNLCKILKAYPDYCAVFTIRVSSSVPGRIKPAKLATTFGRKVIDFFEKQGVERERLKAVPEVTTEVPWLDVRVLLVSPERFDEASEETS